MAREAIVYVARIRQRTRLPAVPLVVPASSSQQSSEVQVVEQVDLDSEIDTQVDLPQTGHFGSDFVIKVDNESDADSEATDIGGRPVNLLEEEDSL